MTAEDFDFALRALSESGKDAISLKDLLLDESTRDSVLDLDKLHDSLIDTTDCVKVSPAFYFYVTVRKALRGKNIDDRELADYIASILLAFADRGKLQKNLSRHGLPESVSNSQPYISDMLAALQKATSQQAFIIRSHIGNYTLFLSGIFAERIKSHSHLRGGPDLRFYEQIGQSNYHFAARDKLAQDAHIDKLLDELADRFHQARLALNDLADRIFHLSDPPVEIIRTS